MPSLVEMKYNPYEPRMQIKINGESPSDFSRLVQYSDEDIRDWITGIFDAIYSEIRDDFFLVFTGRDSEADLLCHMGQKCPHCVGFRHNDFAVSTPLQKRMGKLNQLIKNAGITDYRRTVINAYFYISLALGQYEADIVGIEIKNLFCTVHPRILARGEKITNGGNAILFILSENILSGQRSEERIAFDGQTFVLVLSTSPKAIADVKEKSCYIQTGVESLLNTVFDCLLLSPLTMAFRDCAKSVRGGNKIQKDVALITSVDPIICVEFEHEVEVGHSVKIHVATDPPMKETPELVYRIDNPKIASCDGLSIYGQQEGQCVLDIYRVGEKKPFLSKRIRTYKRNRIQSFVLSDDEILIGLHDTTKIAMSYYPENADNADTIAWRSSDESIVQVDAKGCAHAVGVGNCRLICTAENVSAQCLCAVKPYMEDITFDLPFAEDETLYLEPMQEIKIAMTITPPDCIDNGITIQSSDMDVTNIVGRKILAKKGGRATITVQNSSDRICRSFTVVVSAKELSKPTRKKGGLFGFLFN